MAAEPRHYQALGLVRWERSQPETRSQPSAEPVDPMVGQASADPVPSLNSMTQSKAPSASARRQLPRADAPQAEQPGSVGQAEDERIAQMNWADLRAELARRSRPPARQGVFGVGVEDAPLFVIGEAPGADEDRLGEPFVGRAGQLLDAMLQTIGHSRQQNVYIANICKFRPPDNRDPRPEEISSDLPILLRQMALVKPKLLLAVGRIAAQTLLQCETPIGKLRGQIHQHQASGAPLLVTYHPAYLLRSPLQKAKSWEDLKRVARHLG